MDLRRKTPLESLSLFPFLMIGRTISHYRIIDRLGAGGMGEVYRARDEQLDRDVGIKFLPAGLLADETARRRFRKEALTLARLHHANIGVIYEFGSEDGLDFLVMECIPGVTLAQRLTTGPIGEKEALAIAAQVASALEEAHEQNVVHRDLKPSNVMLTPKGQAKVLDFGLARFVRSVGSEAPTESIDEPRGVAGTLPYMAPEQLLGEPVDQRADIHAFGALLYEMLTARRAFAQRLVARLTDAILHEPPLPPRALVPGVSAESERIVLKCLEKSPENRYQSARELLIDIRAAATSFAGPPANRSSVGAQGVRQAGRRHWPILVAVSLIALAATAWIWRGATNRVKPAAGTIPPHPVLAVLPLRALGNQTSDSELGLGLSDAIITGLGSSSSLTVRPVRDVLPFEQKSSDPVQAGKLLDADAVLDGTLQRINNVLRINVQLWQVSSGAALWSQKYDVHVHDVFALQDKIGARVAEALRVELAAAARQRLRAEYSRDPAVYTSLLHGRSLMLHSSRQNTLDAISIFRDVLRTEPKNAVALAWLARSCRTMNFLYDPQDPQWVDCGEANARRALQIDPGLAEAYAALAGVLWTPQRGFQHDQAYQSYRKALALNPNMAQAHAYLGVLFDHVGLYDRAFGEVRHALDIEPDNLRARAEISSLYRLAGEYPQAEEAARAALRIDPDDLYSRDALIQSLLVQRKLDEASALLKQNYFGNSGFRINYYGGLLAAYRGHFAESERRIVQAANAARGFGHFHHVAFAAGQVFAMAGKGTEAVAWLRQAAAAGMPGYRIYRDDPVLKKLNGNPGYQRFLAERLAEWQRRQREW